MVLVCYKLKYDHETRRKSAKSEHTLPGKESFNALGIGVRLEV